MSILPVLVAAYFLLVPTQQVGAKTVSKPSFLQESLSPNNGEAITAHDYCDFLNSIPSSNSNDCYDERILGTSIIRAGFPGNYHYDLSSSASASSSNAISCITGVSRNNATLYCDYKNCSENSSSHLQPLPSSLSCDLFLRSNRLSFQLISSDAVLHQASGEESLLSGLSEKETLEGLLFATLEVAAEGAMHSASRKEGDPLKEPARERLSEVDINRANTQLHESLHEKITSFQEAELIWKNEFLRISTLPRITRDVATTLIKKANDAFAHWSKERDFYIKMEGENEDTEMQSPIFTLIKSCNQTAEAIEKVVQFLKPKTLIKRNEAGGIVSVSNKLTPPKVMEGGFLFPQQRGCFHNGRRYTEHALERMAPETPEVMEYLQTRAFQKANALGLEVSEALLETWRKQSTDFKEWWKKYRPQPRGILPTEVEAEIAAPGTTDLHVITNEDGAVITVMRKVRLAKVSRSTLDDKIISHENKRPNNFSLTPPSLKQKKCSTETLLAMLHQDHINVGKKADTTSSQPLTKITEYFLRQFYQKKGMGFSEPTLQTASGDRHQWAVDRTLKMIGALRDIQRTAARTDKKFAKDFYFPDEVKVAFRTSRSFNNWNQHAQTMRKKACKSIWITNEMDTNRPHTFLSEEVEKGKNAWRMKSVRRMPKVTTVRLYCESEKPFQKIRLAQISSAVSRTEVKTASKSRSQLLEKMGTLFEDWIIPYVKEKLKKHDSHMLPLEHWERLYLEGILSSETEEKPTKTASKKMPKSKKTSKKAFL